MLQGEGLLRPLIVGERPLVQADAEQERRAKATDQDVTDIGTDVKVLQDGGRAEGQIDAEGSQEKEEGEAEGRDGVGGQDGGAGAVDRRPATAGRRGHGEDLVDDVVLLGGTILAIAIGYFGLIRPPGGLPHRPINGGEGRRAVLEGRAGARGGYDEQEDAADDEDPHRGWLVNLNLPGGRQCAISDPYLLCHRAAEINRMGGAEKNVSHSKGLEPLKI